MATTIEQIQQIQESLIEYAKLISLTNQEGLGQKDIVATSNGLNQMNTLFRQINFLGNLAATAGTNSTRENSSEVRELQRSGLPSSIHEINDLVLKNMGLAGKLASNAYSSLPSIDGQDLYQAALEGLVQAAHSYNDPKVNFASYSWYRIHGNIVDMIRELSYTGRRQIGYKEDALPDHQDNTGSLKIEPVGPMYVVSLEQMQEEQEGSKNSNGVEGMLYRAGAYDVIPDVSPPESPEELAQQRDRISCLIAKYIPNPRNRQIFLDRYGFNPTAPEGMTYLDLAKKYGISESRVSQITARALEYLKVPEALADVLNI